MRSWIIIPAFNEETRLANVLHGLRDKTFSIVVVDDGSEDRTALVAKNAGAVVLRHLINRGQGAALRTGIQFALEHGAEEIITFDADGQHQPEDLSLLITVLRKTGADLVLGSRFLGNAPGIPLHRWCLLKLAVVFTRITTGLNLTDVHNGLRAMTAEAARIEQLRRSLLDRARMRLRSFRWPPGFACVFMRCLVPLFTANRAWRKGNEVRPRFEFWVDLQFRGW